MVKLGTKYPEIVVLDAEVKNSTYAEFFKQKFPKRFFECFIAEQNMVSMAVGMSRMGKIPFCSTFAAFLTRAFDQIRMASYSKANIKLIGSHCGVSIGFDGASQMGLEDISMMKSIANSTIFYPADSISTEKLTEIMALTKGIFYLRTTREKTPALYNENEIFEIGGFKIHKFKAQNKKIIIITAGITLFEALKAQEELAKEGIEVLLIDLYSIKPINKEKLLLELGFTNGKPFSHKIITVEDHYFDGGLGDAVLNVFADIPNVAIKKLAVTKIPHSGTPLENLKSAGIDAETISKAVNRLI